MELCFLYFSSSLSRHNNFLHPIAFNQVHTLISYERYCTLLDQSPPRKEIIQTCLSGVKNRHGPDLYHFRSTKNARSKIHHLTYRKSCRSLFSGHARYRLLLEFHRFLPNLSGPTHFQQKVQCPGILTYDACYRQYFPCFSSSANAGHAYHYRLYGTREYGVDIMAL